MSPLDVPVDRSGSSSLGLLERARELAESLRPSSSHPLGPPDTLPKGGDKGDKREKGTASQARAAVEPIVAVGWTVENPEIAWRLRAMRGQVPACGSILFLVARDIQPSAGTCQSCGDPLGADQQYRCRPCVEAATLALQEQRDIVLGTPSDEAPR